MLIISLNMQDTKGPLGSLNSTGKITYETTKGPLTPPVIKYL